MIHTTDDLFHAVRALTEELNELERLRGQVRAAEAIANVGKRLVERKLTHGLIFHDPPLNQAIRFKSTLPCDRSIFGPFVAVSNSG